MNELRDRAETHIIEAIANNHHKSLEVIAEAVLLVPELAIVDREAELPKNDWGNEDMKRGWDIAQQDMLKAGWVKGDK